MRATLLAVVIAAAALAVGASVAAAPAARTACNPSPFTKGGSSGVVFCGPAKATVKVGGKTYRFSGGACTRKSKYFNLNIGTDVLSGPKQKFSYLGVLVGQYPGVNAGTPPAPKDGTYGGGLVTIRWQGASYDLNGYGDKNVKVTLKKGRTAGTFSGATFLGAHTKVSGSFSC